VTCRNTDAFRSLPPGSWNWPSAPRSCCPTRQTPNSISGPSLTGSNATENQADQDHADGAQRGDMGPRPPDIVPRGPDSAQPPASFLVSAARKMGRRPTMPREDTAAVAFVVDDLAGVAGRAGSRCWPQETDRVGAGPEHPDPDRPQQPRRLDHGGGMRPRPATSTPRCCPSASGCPAPSTPTPWTPAPASPNGPGEAGDDVGTGVN
jgi:hypothetical protein